MEGITKSELERKTTSNNVASWLIKIKRNPVERNKYRLVRLLLYASSDTDNTTTDSATMRMCIIASPQSITEIDKLRELLSQIPDGTIASI